MSALSYKRKCGPLQNFGKKVYIYIPDPKNYPIPHTSSKNQKQEKVSQVKEKGKEKTKFQSPVWSPICRSDKSFLWTRPISLVSTDI